MMQRSPNNANPTPEKIRPTNSNFRRMDRSSASRSSNNRRSPENNNNGGFGRGTSPNFTPTRSNLGNSSRSTPKRGMSAKQRRFYERLQNHKKRKGASPSPIRNNARAGNLNRGMEVHYDSQVPEQEKIFDPNKSINLMAQDPYA